MAPITNHVTSTITKDSVGLSKKGFGTAVFFSNTATFVELLRRYNSFADVIVDFAVTTSPEYLAAQAFFSQNPHPNELIIAKASLPATMVYQLSVLVVRNSYKYTVRVKGEGITATEASYTSDASATDGEIIIGLVAAIDVVVGNNYTATGTTSPATITGDAAGDWFSLEADPADLTLIQTTVDPGIATDLAALKVADDDWYALYTWTNSNAFVLAAAAWVEANGKRYAADTNDSACATAGAGGGDTLDDLLPYSRTFGTFHRAPNEMAGAAWLGECLHRAPGTQTWKFKNLATVNVYPMNATYRANIKAKNGNAYEQIGGRGIMFPGTTGDGEFIDVGRFLDWQDDDLITAIAAVLVAAAKIPFTDAGAAMLESAMRASIKRGVAIGGFRSDPEPTFSVPKIADVSTANRGDRILPDLKWAAQLAGAVHEVIASGTVSV